MQNTIQGEALNPYPRYRIMRKEHPVYFNPELQFWQVFCYDDVQRVLSDHASFSSNLAETRIVIH
jgi:cytochrome P450